MNAQILKNEKVMKVGVTTLLGIATGIALYKAIQAKIRNKAVATA